MKRCGPSHRHMPNASALLENSIRHPKRTFEHYRRLADVGRPAIEIDNTNRGVRDDFSRMTASRQKRSVTNFRANEFRLLRLGQTSHGRGLPRDKRCGIGQRVIFVMDRELDHQSQYTKDPHDREFGHRARRFSPPRATMHGSELALRL